jgi:outer membrane biogenesis lipoprotein LolB
MRRNIFIFNVVTVILFGCLSIAQAQSDGDTVTGQDVKKETKELLTTLQQYTVGQRDQAAEEAGQALTKLDRRIGELERRIEDDPGCPSESEG